MYNKFAGLLCRTRDPGGCNKYIYVRIGAIDRGRRSCQNKLSSPEPLSFLPFQTYSLLTDLEFSEHFNLFYSDLYRNGLSKSAWPLGMRTF